MPVIPLHDAAEAMADCADFLHPDFTRANSFVCPAGEAPARGWFLLHRDQVDQLKSEDRLVDAVIADDDGYRQWLRKLVFLHAVRISPGAPNDPNACYLAYFADRRWLCHNPTFALPVNRQYNVRAPGYTTTDYYEDSLDDGEPWTWDRMVEDLWTLNAARLGDYPGLPVVDAAESTLEPDGRPEGWRFVGVSAWRALCQVLSRIGCTVAVDLAQSERQYTIVRVGQADNEADRTLARAIGQGRDVFDAECVEAVRGKIPYGVEVYFRRVERHTGSEPTTPRSSRQWSTNPVYTVQVVGPESGKAEPGVYAPIWDDLPAYFGPDGEVTDDSREACETRARERADDFYRQLRSSGGGRLHQAFAGAVGFRPGSTIKAVQWKQLQAATEHFGGLVTEIVRHPFRVMTFDEDWQSYVRDSNRAAPPDLTPALPMYPELKQTVRVDSLPTGYGPGTRTRYGGTVLRYNPETDSFLEGETCLVRDLNGSALAVGRNYTGRLSGEADGLPVYLVDGELPAGYGQFCVDLVESDCVNGQFTKVFKSLHANVPIWIEDVPCKKPPGGPPGSPGSSCPTGQVDTKGFTPCDCMPAQFMIDAVGYAGDGCGSLNGSFLMRYRQDGQKWDTGGSPSDFTLSYAAPLFRVTDRFGNVWTKDGTQWDCLGSNTLTLSVMAPGCLDVPPDVTVRPA